MYNYLGNQFLSPLTLCVRIPLRRGVLDTTLCDKFVSDLRQVGGFSPDPPVTSINITELHDIAKILLKVALKTITLIII
jgi:hypothetical protein